MTSPTTDTNGTRRAFGLTDGLPTREMRRRALFEGVLDDKGGRAGYPYFSRRARAGDEVVFRADLADAQDGEPVASIDIPFIVE